MEYNYKMLFEDRKLKIITYNIETIIAEKLQALVFRGTLNGRMKDYYDLYYLLTYYIHKFRLKKEKYMFGCKKVHFVLGFGCKKVHFVYEFGCKKVHFILILGAKRCQTLEKHMFLC